MENAIISKLRILIQRGVVTEAEALYFLVEIRKLSELTPPVSGKHELMKMYCDWVAHTSLCGPKAQQFVKSVDAVYPKLLDGSLTKREWLDIRGFFNLDIFQRELIEFLRQHDLPQFNVKDWHLFLKLFFGVIEDCPLRCKAENANLKYVDEVVDCPFET